MKSIDKEIVSIGEIEEVPSGSIYDDKSFLCCKLAYFPVADIYILGHWIVKLYRPLFLFVLFTYDLAIGIYDCLNFIPNNTWKIVFLVLLSVLNFNLLISYLSTIGHGPGYMSYNYNKVDGTEDTWYSRMSNIVTYQEQMDFAKQNERPPRASFSVNARRYVLRADHYCYWTESWIGLKNLRYFTLTLFWSIISGVAWILSHIWWFKNEVINFKFIHILTYVGILITIILILFSAYYLTLSLKNLKDNITFIEKWKKTATNYKKDNCLDNFAEVCGQKKYCPFWIFPCFPFKPVEDGFYKNIN